MPLYTQALAVVGGVAAAAAAAKLARVLWLRAQISIGPVKARSWAGKWALVTGGAGCATERHALAAALLRCGYPHAHGRCAGPVPCGRCCWPGSEGIGKATALALARCGMNVVIVSRSQQKLDAARQEIQAASPGVQVRMGPRCARHAATKAAARIARTPPEAWPCDCDASPMCNITNITNRRPLGPWQVHTIAADVSKPEGRQRLLQQLSSTPITCFIANAGGGVGKGPMPYW